MNQLFWFGLTVLCAAALSYLSGFVGEAVKGWREGWQEARAGRLVRTTIEPPQPFPPPPDVVLRPRARGSGN